MSTSSSMSGRHQRQRVIATLLLGTLCAAAVPASALPEDRDQPIYIRSDRAERDERIGTTVYTGDVEIDQGSMHISAERVTVRDADEAVVQIVAVGKPAKLHQKTSPEREPVYARALTIQFDVGEEVLTLIDDASVTQHEGATVNGDRIVYYTLEQRVVATGDTSASSKDPRVNVVIPPPKRKSAPQDSSGSGPR